MLLRRLVCCTFLSCVAMLFCAIAAPAKFSVSIAPAEVTLKPGEHYSGFITVNNSGLEAVRIRAYLGDWQTTKDGVDYLKPGKLARGAASWMKVSPAQLSVAAGGSERIYYEITMPGDAALAGSYWAMIFVEEASGQARITAAEQDKPEMKINTVVRYAVQVFITVPGTEVRKASFTGTGLEPVEDGFDLTATFANQGNIHLRPNTWLEVRNAKGETVYSQEHLKITVLPGYSRDYVFKLRKLSLPPGKYIALVIADYGAASLVAAQAQLEVTAK
jgi:P pilus assembly chaperone PapD